VLKSIEKEFLYCITRLNNPTHYPLANFEAHFETPVLEILSDFYKDGQLPEWLERDLEVFANSFVDVALDKALTKILGFCQRQKNPA
jgi:hypothetical protein